MYDVENNIIDDVKLMFQSDQVNNVRLLSKENIQNGKDGRDYNALDINRFFEQIFCQLDAWYLRNFKPGNLSGIT